MNNIEALASNALVEQQRATSSATTFYTQLVAEQNKEIQRLSAALQRWRSRYRQCSFHVPGKSGGEVDDMLSEKNSELFPEGFWDDV